MSEFLVFSGFENFDAMRTDPTMIFMERCGPPKTATASSGATAAGGADSAKDDANMDNAELASAEKDTKDDFDEPMDTDSGAKAVDDSEAIEVSDCIFYFIRGNLP